jgi:hypothetical protein
MDTNTFKVGDKIALTNRKKQGTIVAISPHLPVVYVEWDGNKRGNDGMEPVSLSELTAI